VADAGQYVLLDLFWDERVNEYDKPVPIFKRHLQGEVLDLDEAEATRLVDAGSVEPEGARENRELELARARLRVALAQYPDDLRPLAPSDEELDELARRETPLEELHVHHREARGFTNEGHPKYAATAHGEGGATVDDPDLNVDDPDEASSTVADLDATQASLDDGGKDTRNARSAQSARRRADVDEQAKRADVQAPAKQVPAKVDRDNN
jgi:outer membrane protein TolC